MQTIKEIWEYKQMIISLVRKDLRGRYKGSVLGFLWTFINPLLQLMVFTMVFSIILRSGIETGKREISWTTSLALVAFFQNNDLTKTMIDKMDDFNNKLSLIMDTPEG